MKLRKHILFFSLLLCFSASLLLPSGIYSCNGKKGYYDTTDALTRYPEINVVDFSISGTAACSWCSSEDVNITGLQVEVVPDDDVTVMLAMNVFASWGSFSFSNLRYRSGVTLTVYGRLYHGFADAHWDTSTTITVPDENDKVISCILNFKRN